MWNKRRSEQTEQNYRDPFQRDHARIIHSASFRRLQSKTQVLGLGESDFYRTRLTHSLEVAQIAAGITSELKHRDGEPPWKKHLPDDYLIQSIGLAHDLGHPPFGHGGEKALNLIMHNDGGFEGNAQTLRILTKLEKHHQHYGLDVTRRTLLGILKYPCRYSKVKGKKEPVKGDFGFKPPKCFYDEDVEFFEWILAPFQESDQETFQSFDKSETDEHSKPKYKSLDTSIMELADDISYSIHDLEDAIALDMVKAEHWDELSDKLVALDVSGSDFNAIGNDLFSGDRHKRKQMIGKLVNHFVTRVQVKKNCEFHDPLLRYNATLSTQDKDHLKAIHDGLTVQKVIESPNVQLLEFKGQKLVSALFEALSIDPMHFLPESTRDAYREAKEKSEKKRVICDYIAGMTDPYATRLYEKIYLPNRGSIFDRL